jgi:hypothetical protein
MAITLQQFTEYLHRAVDEHRNDYEEHNNEDPTNWPLDMDIPEWLEQFDIFMQNYD